MLDTTVFYLPIQWNNSENIEILIARSSAAFRVQFIISLLSDKNRNLDIFTIQSTHLFEHIYIIYNWMERKKKIEKQKKWHDNQIVKRFFLSREPNFSVYENQNKYENMFEQGVYLRKNVDCSIFVRCQNTLKKVWKHVLFFCGNFSVVSGVARKI